ncbi:MAG: hypothetical protein RL582_1080 [Bacteroidota bacterium]
MKGRMRCAYITAAVFFLSISVAIGQPTWTFDPFGKEQKPKEYEEKKLGSEKTADKKFTRIRRFTQNNVTRFNYYFNANNKLNAVVEMAKASQQDDHSHLIPFYGYSLDNTAAQQVELDSVIYKSTAGILLHDLRSEWVDNLYLLIGKSYLYRKVFDSAALTFQFINYNLFPRKKDEDDNRVVGTSADAASYKLSIANSEKRNFIQKVTGLPPSRNEALIWLARTYIEMAQFGESAGLINILQEDPNLPKRLRDDLDQVTAYWYFQQQGYDSAAHYLEKALPSAETKSDRSRWYFLLGQLNEMNGKYEKASEFYNRSASKTVNPLLDIYARLNDAKMLRNTGNLKELDNNIATLVKMAKRDKYETYRDILYHSAGMLSLQKPDTTQAIGYFEKSLTVNENNLPFRNKAHLVLGRIAYQQKQYKDAADHYDSLDINDLTLSPDSSEVSDRKTSLRKVATQLMIIETEDSLQMVASLPPADRDLFVKKLVKKLRKENELPDTEPVFTGETLNSFGNDKNNKSTDLFTTSTKGEWYFYNATLKSRGFNEFKSKWGRRENTDNWRRLSALTAGMGIDASSPDPMAPVDAATDESGKPLAFSYDALMQNLPLSQESLDSSNLKISQALIELARLFQYELQDYQQAIYTYEIYLQRFPDKLEEGELYLGMYYCYSKLNDKEKADYYKHLLETEFGNSKALKTLNNPNSLQPEKNNPEVLARYGMIYDLFIGGQYEKAVSMKRKEDSVHGKQYWTPQLLYIESIYHIKCGLDSEAIVTLTQLMDNYPQSPLSEKALTLIDVLFRKREILNHLDTLQVTRKMDDDKILVPTEQNIKPKTRVVTTNVKEQPKLAGIKPMVVKPDSVIKIPSSMVSGEFIWQASKQHLVVMVLNQVDPVYVNESKNALKRFVSSSNPSVLVAKDTLDGKNNLLVFSIFESADDAMIFYEKIKKAAPAQLSWLPAKSYSFAIITQSNLELLKKNKQLEAYKKLLSEQYPGKF